MKITHSRCPTLRSRSVKSMATVIIFILLFAVPVYGQKISLTEADDKRYAKTNVGNSLAVSLKGNLAIGYIWEKVEVNQLK